jgi:dihydroxy-acid dehydratase
MALPGSGSPPAIEVERDRFAVAAGKAVLGLMEKHITSRDILTREAFENAVRIGACTGGSTNIFLHLPAIAHEAGLKLTMAEIDAICQKTPHFVDLMPGGKYTAYDVHKVGGAPKILKSLLDVLGCEHEDVFPADPPWRPLFVA